jgi:Amiloride-sensitive sodium channel
MCIWRMGKSIYTIVIPKLRTFKKFKKRVIFFSYSAMDMVFREAHFVAFKRTQLFGKTELLANCGGLLNLFLGFSVTSILELIYFCTIRLVCNFKRHMLRK